MLRGSLFVQLPLEVLIDDRLSTGAKLFLAHILRWDWGNGCWLTDKQLARELDMSVRSVRNHTKALEEAGHLWLFEDREGMTVRLVVRAGRAYPKPRGLGAPPARKKSSTSSCARHGFIHEANLEVHETTTDYQLNPVLKERSNRDEISDVVTKKPEELDEETIGDCLEINPEIVEEISVPNLLNPAIETLQDIGIVAPVAQVLARRHSTGRIQAAVTYATGYRGDLLNKPGYVVSALQGGWKLPGWCFKHETRLEAPKQPVESYSAPDMSIPPDWEDRRRESPYEDLWNQVCDIIKAKIQPQSFAMWIQPCYISVVSEGVITLAAPNGYIADWVEEHYLWLIQREFREVVESNQKIRITELASDLLSI